jgi:hypothetical protein
LPSSGYRSPTSSNGEYETSRSPIKRVRSSPRPAALFSALVFV